MLAQVSHIRCKFPSYYRDPGVVGELATALDTDRGLAAILGTTPATEAATPVDPAAPSPVSDDEPPATPSILDDLAAIYFAPAGQRLQLRLGSVSYAARATLRQLQSIREAFAHIHTGAHPLNSPLDHVPAALERQRASIARVTTLMAQSLAALGHPEIPMRPAAVSNAAQLLAEVRVAGHETMLAKRVRTFGEDHPETRNVRALLADSYRQAKRFAEAPSPCGSRCWPTPAGCSARTIRKR